MGSTCALSPSQTRVLPGTTTGESGSTTTNTSKAGPRPLFRIIQALLEKKGLMREIDESILDHGDDH